MKCTNVFCAIVLILAPWLSSFGQAATASQQIVEQSISVRTKGTIVAERSWLIGAANSLKEDPPSKTDVNVFVQRILGVASGEAAVCSATFADLAGGRYYQLIASIDYSGRKFCNEVLVVQTNGNSFEMQTLPAWEVDDVNSVIRKLDGIPHVQLVLPEALTQYNGAKCVATWPRIYEVNDDSISDASSRYLGFYAARLTALQADSGTGAGTICRDIETDKLKRVLGIADDAGFRRAEEWLKSSDIDLELKALAVFADIGNQASVDALTRSSFAPDSMVADVAKQYLARLTSR